MGYRETLDWMFAQLPMYQQKGKVALKNKLDNIQNFVDQLHNPEQKFKSIHVAGTNGKGSCSHMLASVLQEAGYKVGLYTSPHLKDFRERIKINGSKIRKKDVIAFVQEHRSFMTNHQLSFFEMTVAMAFSHFAKEQVDIAVIEVGLGGRLDSTNIIFPEVSLITNIGYDHMEVLGDTLEKIAEEKAGIIKKGIPVVISERQTETEAVFKRIAHERESDITFSDSVSRKTYKTDLLGEYQKKNIQGVVACIQQLRHFDISEQQLEKGLQNVVKNTGLLGRWQVIQEKPTCVCDTAHNQEGLKIVLQQLEREKFDNLHLVLGFVADKDVETLLSLFPKEGTYYFVKPDIPRGLDVHELYRKAGTYGLNGRVYGSVLEGFKNALVAADKDDFVYVGGSTFVVAEVI